MNCSRGIQLCGNFLAQVFVQILDVHLEIFSSMRSFHFLPPANEFMFGELAASMKGARFIWCIICIQHKSTSGEAVLEDFCWRPVLTCVHISNMLRQLASGYRSWDVVRTEHFFEVILSYPTHTHRMVGFLCCHCCWALKGTWVNILPLFSFPSHYLFVDRSLIIVGQHLEVLMELHWFPLTFPLFLAGGAMFSMSFQRSWSPLKSWVFPLHLVVIGGYWQPAGCPLLHQVGRLDALKSSRSLGFLFQHAGGSLQVEVLYIIHMVNLQGKIPVYKRMIYDDLGIDGS